MKTSKFKLDLGHGDTFDVTIEREEQVTLATFVVEVNQQVEWLIIGDTAIQKSHIKRIIYSEK